MDKPGLYATHRQTSLVLGLGHPTWLSLLCYPIGWLAVKVGVGEELVGIGRL